MTDLAHLSQGTILTALVVVIVIALAGLYVVGSQVTQRRARELVRTAIEVLKPVGREGSYQRLGTAGSEIRLVDLRPPYTGMRVVVWLAPREIFPLWLYNRLRGRRDLIGLASDLLLPPRASFELCDPSAPSGKRALRSARARGWKESPWTVGDCHFTLAAQDPPEARKLLARIVLPASVERLQISRLGISTDSPHLSVTVGQPNAFGASGAGFVEWLGRVADIVAESPGVNRVSERPKASKLPRARRSSR